MNEAAGTGGATAGSTVLTSVPQHGGKAPRTAAGSAFGWSFFNTAASRLATLGIGVFLARLLGPEEFGTYAVAFVALMAVLSFNELGVSLAIVRWPTDPKHITGTVTTVSLLTSGVLTALCVVLAPAFAAAMGDAQAAPVVQLLSVSVLISGAVAAPAALLQREFQQRRRMLIDQVGIWVGALSSLALALAGAGAMSLAVGRVAGSLVAAALFVRLSPQPYRLGWDRQVLPGLLKFGLPLAGASLLLFAASYADQLVVGHLLGAEALGYYVLAYNLASWPVVLLSQPLRSVAPAVFARMQGEPERMQSTLLCVIGVLAAVAFPSCLFIAGTATPVVRFVYGPEWAPAAAALAWLAVAATFKIVFELAYDYLVIVGVSVAILRLQLISLGALTPAVVLGASHAGVAGAGAAQLTVAAIVVLPLYLVQFHRAGISGSRLLRRLAAPVLASALVGTLTAVCARGIAPDLLALTVSGAVTALVATLLLWKDRQELRWLQQSMSRRLASEPLVAT